MNDIGIIWLTRGKFALVDIEDYRSLTKWKWNVSDKGYAGRQVRDANGKIKAVLMHRVVNKTPKDKQTDHINGYKFDNRKRNLRNSDNSQNQVNMHKKKGKFTSKYKGVYWSKRHRRWIGQTKRNGKTYRKNFHSEIEAARYYNQLVVKLHGEFARVNELYQHN